MKSFNELCCNESIKTCMVILYVAVLYNTVDVEYFLPEFWQHFPHDMYIVKVMLMNTLCSTQNISVKQVSSSAQQTLPNLVRWSICFIRLLGGNKIGNFTF
jgi:hypothetical protein